MSNHKITVQSPANIAFIKYWGRYDHQLFLPRNNSISMTMSGCMTTTTAELDSKLTEDLIEVKFFDQPYQKLIRRTEEIKQENIFAQIDRIRKIAGSNVKVHIKSENNFPADAGIASSASSFSALTAALLLVFGLHDKFEDKIEFSKQVRMCGSGSAIRSVMGGFVEMLSGKTHDDSYAVQIADQNHWQLTDIVAIVNPEKKKISSSQGHLAAQTSPYLETRIQEMQPRIKQCREAILQKDFSKLGQCIEQDSISMHIVMMTQNPPAFYWGPGSISIIKEVMRWREEDGLEAYCTLDAGPNVHVICQSQDTTEVKKRLEASPFVKWTIVNQPCAGTTIIDQHLF